MSKPEVKVGQEHQWTPEIQDALVEVCARKGCEVRRVPGTGVWQRKRGAHWRKMASETIPPCKGLAAKDATPEAKTNRPSCRDCADNSAAGTCPRDGRPCEPASTPPSAPSPLEVVRRTLDILRQPDALALLARQQMASEAFAALATLEESIRADATRFYREREAFFARFFKVADSGQYRADWEAATKRWEESIRAECADRVFAMLTGNALIPGRRCMATLASHGNAKDVADAIRRK